MILNFYKFIIIEKRLGMIVTDIKYIGSMFQIASLCKAFDEGRKKSAQPRVFYCTSIKWFV